MYRLNWLIVLGVIVLTGCEPADINNYYDIDVVVEDNGNDGAEEPVDDDSPEVTRLEIAYQGPGPGTSIEIGECGTLIEMTYAAVGGDVTMNTHRFVQFTDDVWSNPFSSVTFLLDGIIHEDLVEFDPNPTGDHHIFNEAFVIPEGEEFVATYSVCIRSDMTLSAQSGSVQAALDYRFFEAEDENGDAIEFEEEFQYGHQVVVSDSSQWDTCEFELVVSETLNQTSCSGPLETVIAVEDLEDGDVVQDPLDDGNTLMHVIFEGNRYTVPTGMSFTTWFGEDACPSCADVMEIDSVLNASIPLFGNVTVKPGSKILTVGSDSNMWVVDSCATARAVTPGVAEDIYGTDWADRLVIMPDVFFVDYLIGAPVNSAADFDLAAAEARTIVEELACLWGEDPVEEEEPEPLVTSYMPITGTFNTYTKGESAAWLGARRITNEAGANLLLTGLQITIQGDDDGNPGNGIAADVNPQDHISACWLQDSVGPMAYYLSGIESVASDGGVYFGGLPSLMVPAGGQITVQVMCDLAVMPPQSGDADAFVAVQFSTADIEVVYADTMNQIPSDQIVFDPAEQPLNGNADFYIQVIDHGEIELAYDPGTPTGYMAPYSLNAVASFNGVGYYEYVLVEELAFGVYSNNPAMIEYIEIEYTSVTGVTRWQTQYLVPSQPTEFTGMDWLVEDSIWSTISVNVLLNGNATTGDEVSVTLYPWHEFGATGTTSGHAFSAASDPVAPVVIVSPTLVVF